MKKITKTKPAAEMPAWATETPQECEYCLEMSDERDLSPCETVNVTRAEYLELKHHLAKMRGYKVPKAA